MWIAPVTQLEDPPLYYLLAAAAMKPLDRQAILAQLYAGRLVSLGLFLLTLAIAWGVAAELTPPGSVMRWMLPLSMALLPGFADVMTSLNNSVGAVAFFSLFLWGSDPAGAPRVCLDDIFMDLRSRAGLPGNASQRLPGGSAAAGCPPVQRAARSQAEARLDRERRSGAIAPFGYIHLGGCSPVVPAGSAA